MKIGALNSGTAVLLAAQLVRHFFDALLLFSPPPLAFANSHGPNVDRERARDTNVAFPPPSKAASLPTYIRATISVPLPPFCYGLGAPPTYFYWHISIVASVWRQLSGPASS